MPDRRGASRDASGVGGWFLRRSSVGGLGDCFEYAQPPIHGSSRSKTALHFSFSYE